VTSTLVVDAANVVGSRADGWWKDRAGATRRLHEALMTADPSYDRLVLVVEGAAKGGVPAGRDGHVHTVHAKGSGDDTIVEQVVSARERGPRVAVVTADRALQARVQELGAVALSPTWLLDQLV
jgi:predicted RNA-binding protein with PIN domain